MGRDGSEIIKCYRCGELKPADEFAWRRRQRDQRDSFCRPCRAEYKQEHYAANKAKYVAGAKRRQRRLRRERMRLLFEYFKTHPCSDCGEDDPVVLEFDHLRDKSFNIGAALSYRNWKSILAEIAKCEVVCANCHRRRTYQRQGSVRLLVAAESVEAGGGDRTRTERMETSHAAITPRPRGVADGSSETA